MEKLNTIESEPYGKPSYNTPKSNEFSLLNDENAPAPMAAPSIKTDLFPFELEAVYHVEEKMNSIPVLKDEKNQCEKIIEYKINNGFDYEQWKKKKRNIDGKISLLNNSYKLNYDKYKHTINLQLQTEKSLLESLNKNSIIESNVKSVIHQRIQRRIDILINEINEVDNLETNQNNYPLENQNTISSNTPNEPNDNHNQINDPLLLKIKQRYKEYKKALTYFEENEMISQEKDAISKVRTILSVAKRYKNKEFVSESELPNPITPEYIYGYSKEERLYKFKEILRELIKEKGAAKAKIKKFEDTKEEVIEYEEDEEEEEVEANEENIEHYQKILDKYERLIRVIKDQVKKQWIPAPKYTLKEEKVEYEDIDE